MPILARAGAAAAKGFGMLGKIAAAVDEYFEYVTLLLHGNGTNGAQNNTFLDSSTNNFTITRNGNTTQGTFTPYGSNWSNYFDGTGDSLTVPDSTAFTMGSGDFSVEFWYFPTSSARQLMVAQTNAAGNTLAFWVEKNASNQLRFVVTVGGTQYVGTATATMDLNSWSFIQVVRSGTTVFGYQNGTQVCSASVGSGSLLDSTDVVEIGGVSVGLPVTGYISNVRILKGTASSAAVPTSPLTAITNTSLLTCQSNRFIDNSSNNFTITRNGDVSVQRFSPFNPTTPYAAGTIGGSGYFDGSGDYLTTPNGSSFSFGTGDFTIEGWFYLDGNNQGLSDVSGGTTGYWLWLISGGVMYWQNVRNGANLISVSLSNYLSQWVHFAVVRNSGTTRIYQNGVQIASAADTTNYSGTAGDLNIGRESANPSVLKGYMSNFRIVKGTAVYTSAFTPPTTPLTNITNTSLLLNFTNGGIIDNAMMNDLETVGNAQISTSVSKFGGGSISVINSYLDGCAIASSPQFAFGTGNWTIEGWFYTSQSGSAKQALIMNLNQTTGMSMSVSTSSVEFRSNGQTDISGSGVSSNTWTHLAWVRNGNTVSIYRNGILLVSGTYTNSIGPSNFYVGPTGAQSGVSSSFAYLGYIDDLRITRGYARYTANFTPQTSQWQDQ